MGGVVSGSVFSDNAFNEAWKKRKCRETVVRNGVPQECGESVLFFRDACGQCASRVREELYAEHLKKKDSK